MRARPIHDYGRADNLIVWDVAVNKAPDLATPPGLGQPEERHALIVLGMGSHARRGD